MERLEYDGSYRIRSKNNPRSPWPLYAPVAVKLCRSKMYAQEQNTESTKVTKVSDLAFLLIQKIRRIICMPDNYNIFAPLLSQQCSHA